MNDSSWNNVAIVGVGLIGGSVGKGLLERSLAKTVTGIGRRQSSLDHAQEVGAITTGTTDLAEGVAAAELIVVCTPVSHIVAKVQEAAGHCPAGALITDAGSTKGTIVAALGSDLGRGVRFLGSHPLAGSEKNGVQEAKGNLYDGAVVVLTPTADSANSEREALHRFWSRLGACVVEMSAEDHDAALAATSHVPHLVAAALAICTPGKFHTLSAGGFRDTTRIAAGDPELWKQIFCENRRHVLAALEQLEGTLREFRQALADDDAEAILQLLAQAKRQRDQLEDGC